MRIRMKLGYFSLLSLFLCLLQSCGNGNQYQDIDDYLATLKQENRIYHQKQMPLQGALGSSPMVTYSAGGLRSPFKSTEVISNKITSTNPLQNYPLNMLRFVGTLSNGNNSAAYVMAPDNVVYQVKVGDKLGNRDGNVTNIYSDRLEVTEASPDEMKNKRQRITILQLKEGH